MDNNQGTISCALGCWLVALAGGVLAAALLMVLGDWRFIQAVFGGIVIAVAAGAVVSWIMCKPLPPVGASDTGSAKVPAPKPAAKAAPAPAAAAAPAASGSSAPAEGLVKASKPLPGEADLDARKSTWSYGSGDAAAQPAPVTAAEGPGTKPEALTSARGGTPDNLKEIKGVGPKLEALLHSMGFFHFDQIAGWGPEEVAWVDQNLKGFKGRVSRDNWVAQAKILAAGGETEFSKRVEKGGVYD